MTRINADRDPPCKSALSAKSAVLLLLLLAFGFQPLAFRPCAAASFSGNARLETAYPTGALGWSPAASALTIECWFKISVPSGTNLTQNMTILVNRRSGSQSDPHAYWVYFNIFTGNVELSARGSGVYTNTLIWRPYLDRWYHVAVVRQGEVFTGYADGRQVFSSSGSVGSAANSEGLSIGGWGSGQYLFGEVQEVSIYQRALDKSEIVDNLFADQTGQPDLTGYYKLAANNNNADQLKNFAPTPPSGTATLAATGPVIFEETDAAGEQSTYDTRRNGGRDALVPLSGAFAWEQTALARPTPGIAFDFRFGYSSANSFGGYKLGSADPFSAGPLGPGWHHTFETRLLQAQDFDPSGSGLVVGLMNWNGAIDTWDRQRVVDSLDPNIWYYGTNFLTRHKEYRGELMELDAARYQWTTPDRLTYIFRHPLNSPQVMRGRLIEIRDFNSNSVQLRWNQSIGVLTQVVDTARSTYDFRYDARQILTNVTFGAWQVRFAYDATNRLVSKSLTNTSGLYSPVNTTWQFAYNPTNGLLERILDPRGNTNVLVQYDQYGRKTNTVDALARATRTEYNVPANRQIRNTDSAGFPWLETYDRKGHILAQQDPLTNITAYTYDDRGNRTSIIEPLGWTTFFGYDARANVIARTNALGEVTRWGFHPFFNKAAQQITPQPLDVNGQPYWTNFYTIDNSTGNLLRHSDGVGTLVSYTYTTNGLVESSTDANGHASRFRYQADGFLIARTDPATNTTTFVVNEVGWKLREMNPLGDTTSYTLDLNGNPIRVQDVLGRVFNRVYDANGNLLSTTDGKGQLTTYAYDAANQRTNTTDRTGANKWVTFYTTRGKVDHVTDPLGNAATNFYDAANRLLRVSDPLGNASTNQYDANGNVVALFDKLGQRWTKSYDRLNRVLAETDPLGNTRGTSYDIAGRILQTTTPNGYPALHAYDGRGRLIKWHDAEGFDWLYTYDGNANITNITDALGGHYVMTYGLRNERLSEQNQDNKVWAYAYDELLRLKQQKDPNGTTRIPNYDPAGRVQSVDFSTGRQDSFSYDDNDNPKLIKRRVSGVTTATQFIYDGLDHPIEQTDALAQTVQYGYDPLGRVTALTYPGGKTLTNRYDALGRLTSQADWANRQMTYSYDRADRLIQRIYPNGVTQSNTFDTANRLTGLSHSAMGNLPSAINVALTYAYDKNGNKVGGGEKGTLQWPLPSLTDERADYSDAGRLKTRDIELTNHVSRITYAYDPSGNMTNASGGGQTWTLTYDEDNRTTSIAWDCGLTSKHITNRYDALGRRISKTVDGQTTGYVLSLVGGMERILCDLDSGGNVKAWYVHGPDLCYRVDATNNVICYHADAMANIIALTGTTGTNLAQYAYTPYGRSLGSTNLQSQISNPYLFVGSQGVMEELPSLYFMRARYYSAEAGVFLSTDPVKKIGPTWQPTAYDYAAGNPLTYSDPKGEFIWTLTRMLVNVIIESVNIDLDILVRGKNVTMKDLWARYANAAFTGAVEGAMEEYGGVLFKGAVKYAAKGITQFAGNMIEGAIEGDLDMNRIAKDTLVQNVVSIGFDYGATKLKMPTLSPRATMVNLNNVSKVGLEVGVGVVASQTTSLASSLVTPSRTATVVASKGASATATTSKAPSRPSSSPPTTGSATRDAALANSWSLNNASAVFGNVFNTAFNAWNRP